MCVSHPPFGRGQKEIGFLLTTRVRSEVLRELAHVFITSVEVEHNWIACIEHLAQQVEMWRIASCKL